MIEYVRRHFLYPYPRLTTAQYAAQSIIFDTDFRRTSATVVTDLTGSYPAAIVGCPHAREPGMDFVPDGSLNLGDVTELNASSAFSAAGWIHTGATAITNNGAWFSKFGGGLLRLATYFIPTSTQADVMVIVSDGVLAYGGTSNLPIKPDQLHHLGVVYDGTLTGNANRCKLWVDGVQQALTFTGTIPAATPNTAGSDLAYATYFASTPALQRAEHAALSFRMWDRALTEAEMLAERGDRSRWPVMYDALLDVSLTAGPIASPARVYPAEWAVRAGTFSVIADTDFGSEDGKAVRCLTAGRLTHYNPGLYQDRFWWIRPLASTFVGVGSNTAAHNGAGQNGYFIEFAYPNIYFGKAVAGVYGRVYLLGTYSVARAYQLTLGSTPQGTHDVYIRGGTQYTDWTHFGPLIDTSITTCQYDVVELGVGEEVA